ncbi:peptidylprolyl isomerase fpr3 [Coemansia sp. RSA 486]|nr:peptidylprolyl isomerase fpr3 [Coemansia sp. RSA 486]KAJ2221256.1 peptidylprolyl isomerase fpr3 [Coemansia sp. RSA 485]KAJ2602075.1 peptidylprolyl isomerase fpr3 [Coemansia sp. RSA 1721]
MYRGFWGLTIVPGKTYSQVVDMPFRLSNAALDTTIESNTRTSVLLTVDEKPFVLCSLTPGSIEQQTIDITLSEGENITFETQGDNIIHLTGNFVYDMDEPSSDEDDDDDDDEEQMDLSDVSPEELREMIEEGLIDPRILMGEGESDEEDDSDYGSDDAEVDGRIREITDEEEAQLVAEVEEEEEEEEEEKPVKEVKIKKQAEKKRKADQAAEKKEAASSKKSKQAEKTEKTEKKAEKTEKTEKKAEKTEKKAEKSSKTKSKDCGGGVMAEIMKEGDGQGAKNGQRVGMYYIGKLTNGKVFDKNMGGKPFWFRLGSGEVIRGWDKGILGMKKGGERRLTIPSNMAYGKRGAPPDIPPNATLVFDIRLVDFK